MKFSVIIPAYNSAEFIREALDSIACQNFEDYELIIICDACKDNTAEIAREYGTVYEVDFHHEGATRNFGIDHAKGDWILFMDDDDWWMNDNVLTSINRHLSDDIDVLMFGFIWQHRGYCQPGDWYACWNKCYRREFLDDICFGDTVDRSDVHFTNTLMAKKPRCFSLDLPLYYYNYMRPGSVSYKRGG